MPRGRRKGKGYAIETQKRLKETEARVDVIVRAKELQAKQLPSTQRLHIPAHFDVLSMFQDSEAGQLITDAEGDAAQATSNPAETKHASSLP